MCYYWDMKEAGAAGIKLYKSKVKKLSLTESVFFLTFIGFFVSSLVGSLGNVIDGIIVGHRMETADLCASNVTAPVWFAAAIIGGLLSKGCQYACSDKLAKGKVDEASDILSMTLTAGVGVSVIFTVAVIVFNAPLIRLLGVAPGNASFEPCRRYLIGAVLSVPAATALMQLSNAMYLEGRRKGAVYSVLALSISDILLDLIAVFVINGGMFWMGLSTSLSYYAALWVLLISYRKNEMMIRPHVVRIEFLKLIKLMYRGLPMAVSRMTTAWRTGFTNSILAAASTAIGLAAFNVQVQMNYITNALIFGIAQTAALMSGIYFAEENKKALRKTMVLSVVLVISIGVILMNVLPLEGVTNFILHVYLGDNEDAYEVTSDMLFFYGTYVLAQGIAVLLANYLQATKRIIMSNVVYILDDVVFVYLCLNFWKKIADYSFATDYERVLMTFIAVFFAHAAFVLCIPAIYLIVNRIFVFGWNAVLMLPRGFGVSKDKEFTASPENEEEAVQVSRAIYDFCLQHEVSSKSASVLSLAVEELAVNTVRYGFSEGRTNIIDIRLIIKDDELIMSIRDNSKMFDPKKFYEAVCDDTDKTKNVGIRAAMGLASDITYTTTLKLNNLTMRMPIVV